MSSEFKSISFRVVILSVALLVVQLVLGWIFDLIYPEPKSADDLDVIFLQIAIQDYVRIFLLFLSAILIAKKIPDLTYWKMVLALLALLVLNYHLIYMYESIHYYLIRGLGPEPEKADLKSLFALVSFEPRPPSYEPINHLTSWQLVFFGPTGSLSLFGVLSFLFHSSICRALWISALVYFYFRIRRQKDAMNSR